MVGDHLSEFEQARARRLANQLKEKMELYFPEPPQEARTAEIKAIRADLEKMGFLVTWSGALDVSTLRFSVEVTILLPRETP